MHSLLESKDAWNLLPSELLTVFWRSFVFGLISRAGDAVYQLMEHENQTYPIKAFTIVNKPEVATSLEEKSDCLKDLWNLGFQQPTIWFCFRGGQEHHPPSCH
eukprot:3254181-Amphidinium_carterae.2